MISRKLKRNEAYLYKIVTILLGYGINNYYIVTLILYNWEGNEQNGK